MSRGASDAPGQAGSTTGRWDGWVLAQKILRVSGTRAWRNYDAPEAAYKTSVKPTPAGEFVYWQYAKATIGAVLWGNQY